MVKGWRVLEGIPGKQCQWLGASRVLPEMGVAVGADALLNEVPGARARALTGCAKTGRCHSDEPQAVANGGEAQARSAVFSERHSSLCSGMTRHEREGFSGNLLD